jgi:hypothetical protein
VLTLPLLVLGVRADDTNHAMAMDHLALVTEFLHRCSYFHDCDLTFTKLFLDSVEAFTVPTATRSGHPVPQGARKPLLAETNVRWPKTTPRWL